MLKDLLLRLRGHNDAAEQNAAQLARVRAEKEELRRRLELIQLKLSVIGRLPVDSGGVQNESR